MTSDPDWTETSVGRVALALLAFAGEEGSANPELSVTAVAQRLGRERSQVSRMLKTLAKAGLLEQDPASKLYRLGWRVHHLASKAGDQQLLSAMAPVLRSLVARTRETALVSVLSGNRSLTVAREGSPQSLQAGGWVGRTSPLHASASGRALLADLPDEMVRDVVVDGLAEGNLGRNALRSVDAVLQVLREERRTGYAVAIDELEEGLTSVGAPVTGPLGNVVAALNVSGPTARMVDHIPSIGADLVGMCRHVGSKLRG